jgi:hypothetical protein
VRLPFVFLREAQVRMVRARALRREASSLPHASTSAASWDVDVVFFTEADQVFSNLLLNFLKYKQLSSQSFLQYP